MKELKERVSYLQGLSEGLDVQNNTREGRIINGLIEVLGDVVNSLDDLWDAHRELETYMEAIDEDLYELEGDMYDGEYEDLDEETGVEVTCPKCNESVYFTPDVLEEDDVVEVTCPTCNEVVFVNDGSFDLQPEVIEPDINNGESSRTNIVDI
ncbi:MAG: AraC family transcriptional regulator [Syntrophomonadaceae bacterium]|nr:AraC family transcriptional regulator [Syntrophomonadaceae bacterium]